MLGYCVLAYNQPCGVDVKSYLARRRGQRRPRLPCRHVLPAGRRCAAWRAYSHGCAAEYGESILAPGPLHRAAALQDLREPAAAGATGARYHLELYFACADLPGLAAGVYHYAADEHTLRPLRLGDFRSALVAASGDEPGLAQAPLILAITSTFWRNAYTYKARA